MPAPSRPRSVLVEALSASHILAVYAVIQATEPALSLSGWLRYARATVRSSRRRGALVARRDKAAPACGLLCYRIESGLGGRRVIVVELLVALDLLYPEAVAKAMLRDLDAIAQRKGCDELRIILSERDKELAQSLIRTGYQSGGTILGRMLHREISAAGPVRRRGG